ncbi:hypothetical protein F5879DRAFT_992533 [Lentinula edodes]|uniref:uncharacterized protein n=1 Tax=Lentinula edodes TaxID=5353 RepID=UPI001E8EADD5|nr:uncharacterized protein C8R40DRAFT_1176273 [Lentinula edodes]KAH7869938.1 hypothetical protein C8R40DRAFT_1176273 [Lentinula edodes]KAJ3900812.1 hypothetical protein F5879DRAFT_992533 [Lentinula edodes]
MNIVEKIKHDISGVEDALQNAKSRRDVLCSVLHQEANQLNLTLRRAIRNANSIIERIEDIQRYSDSTQPLGRIPPIYPSHLNLISRLKKAVCSASSNLLVLINAEPLKLTSDSAILTLLLRMHEFPTNPSCWDRDTILTQALDLTKIGLKTVQVLREYRLSNTSTDEPSCITPPCNAPEKSEITYTNYYGDSSRKAWAAIDSFEQEGNKRLEDTQETLNCLQTRIKDHEEILSALNVLVEDVADRVYNMSSRDRPNTDVSYYHDPAIVQGFNHTISLNSLWMMVSCMMVGDQSLNPSLSTLQRCFDCFQVNKDPIWGIQLTENANISYLLDCQGISSYPDSPPSQTIHLAPCPWKPPHSSGIPSDIPLPVSRAPAPDLLHLEPPSPRSEMFHSSSLSEGLIMNKLEANNLGYDYLSSNPAKRSQDDHPTQHRTLLQEFALIQSHRNSQPSPDSDLSGLGLKLETKAATFLAGLEDLEPFGQCNDKTGATGDVLPQNSVTTTKALDNCLIQMTEQDLRHLASASNVYISKRFRLSLPQRQGGTKEIFDLIVNLSMCIGWIASCRLASSFRTGSAGSIRNAYGRSMSRISSVPGYLTLIQKVFDLIVNLSMCIGWIASCRLASSFRTGSAGSIRNAYGRSMSRISSVPGYLTLIQKVFDLIVNLSMCIGWIASCRLASSFRTGSAGSIRNAYGHSMSRISSISGYLTPIQIAGFMQQTPGLKLRRPRFYLSLLCLIVVALVFLPTKQTSDAVMMYRQNNYQYKQKLRLRENQLQVQVKL